MPDDPIPLAPADSAAAEGAAAGAPADHARILTIPRDHDAPLPLILLMIGSMLLLVAAGFYWAERSRIAEHVLGAPARASGGGSIIELDEITDERVPQNLVGRDVALWNVSVTHVPGDFVFWIADDDGRGVPVVLMGEQTNRQVEMQVSVRPGDRLAIFGTMRSIREVRFLDDRRVLRRPDWDRLAREQTYISALRVEHLEQAP